jgi:hypothetical protein
VRSSTFELVESGIEVVDVGLVMLLVMGLEQFAANDWLEGGVGELQLRERDLLGGGLSGKGGEDASGDHLSPHLLIITIYLDR